MRRIIHAQFVVENDCITKDDIRRCCPDGTFIVLDGDKDYRSTIDRLMDVDDALVIELAFKAGLLWKCAKPCSYLNEDAETHCVACGRARPGNGGQVSATVHTDDYKFEFTFNATRWFESADDAMITALAHCGFGGDKPADDVAVFFDGEVPNVTKVFKYLSLDPLMFGSKGDPVGFECYVEPEEARAWIKANKPALFKTLWEECDDEED